MPSKTMKTENRIKYRIIGKKKETPNVFTLSLSCYEEKSLPSFTPGQFITIYFPESEIVEGKAYSISNTPYDDAINITIKEMGDFSKQILELNVGDIIYASLPYGYFFSERDESTLIFLASGIGITPIKSMIISYLKKNSEREIYLFYGCKTLESIVFKRELDELTLKFLNFRVHYFLSKEEDTPKDMKRGRIDLDWMLEEIESVEHPEFLICGSISFVRDMWKGLRNSGISPENIYTESFF